MWVFILLVGFMLGRVFQKWADGTMQWEEEFYHKAYEDGRRDGIEEGRWRRRN